MASVQTLIESVHFFGCDMLQHVTTMFRMHSLELAVGKSDVQPAFTKLKPSQGVLNFTDHDQQGFVYHSAGISVAVLACGV